MSFFDRHTISGLIQQLIESDKEEFVKKAKSAGFIKKKKEEENNEDAAESS